MEKLSKNWYALDKWKLTCCKCKPFELFLCAFAWHNLTLKVTQVQKTHQYYESISSTIDQNLGRSEDCFENKNRFRIFINFFPLLLFYDSIEIRGHPEIFCFSLFFLFDPFEFGNNRIVVNPIYSLPFIV